MGDKLRFMFCSLGVGNFVIFLFTNAPLCCGYTHWFSRPRCCPTSLAFRSLQTSSEEIWRNVHAHYFWFPPMKFFACQPKDAHRNLRQGNCVDTGLRAESDWRVVIGCVCLLHLFRLSFVPTDLSWFSLSSVSATDLTCWVWANSRKICCSNFQSFCIRPQCCLKLWLVSWTHTEIMLQYLARVWQLSFWIDWALMGGGLNHNHH